MGRDGRSQWLCPSTQVSLQQEGPLHEGGRRHRSARLRLPLSGLHVPEKQDDRAARCHERHHGRRTVFLIQTLPLIYKITSLP